jgi:RNA polymerase sigma factor (sigma-70 family)
LTGRRCNRPTDQELFPLTFFSRRSALILIHRAEPARVGTTRHSGDPRGRGAAESSDGLFEELYGRHGHALSNYCRALVSDEHDASDVLQNVAVRAMLALRRGNKPERERAWLYGIAHNEAMSLLRARKDVAVLDQWLVDPHSDPPRAMLTREHLQQLFDDVRALAPQPRQILLMAELSGLSRADIAAALGLSPGAVSQSLSEARAALRADQAAHETPCEIVRSVLSKPDGRRRRTRAVRAHLRGCPSCRSWTKRERRNGLAVLPPTVIPAFLRSLDVAFVNGPATTALATRGSSVGVLRAMAVLGSVVAGSVGVSLTPHPTHRPAVPKVRAYGYRAAGAGVSNSRAHITVQATSVGISTGRSATPAGPRLTFPAAGRATRVAPTGRANRVAPTGRANRVAPKGWRSIDVAYGQRSRNGERAVTNTGPTQAQGQSRPAGDRKTRTTVNDPGLRASRPRRSSGPGP